ncbi:hypothetical protein QBC40DRAFT_274407 [Triangularia verruculosa]|uniref:Uncharacterized protein n=1 Tax=Triangularia verruculosa TaxID=2587418 RepID=A0AAN6XU57_9PEZI|nr:hypothetical protein QBC40DRAFT_274407 [Triangularia verruculosa]
MWTRVSAVRSSLRSACRRPIPVQLGHPLGRRGYASAQGSAAKSSDVPWQLFAVGITVSGVFLMYKPSKPAHPGHGGHDRHSEEGGHEEASKNHQGADSKSGDKDGEASASSNSSDSGDEGPPTPSSSGDSDGPSKEMDDSHESQAQKLHDKQPSQRVDPTEK